MSMADNVTLLQVEDCGDGSVTVTAIFSDDSALSKNFDSCYDAPVVSVRQADGRMSYPEAQYEEAQYE